MTQALPVRLSSHWDVLEVVRRLEHDLEENLEAELLTPESDCEPPTSNCPSVVIGHESFGIIRRPFALLVASVRALALVVSFHPGRQSLGRSPPCFRHYQWVSGAGVVTL